MESFPGEWIEDRAEFVQKYTEPGKNPLKDIIKVHISLEKNSAILSHGDSCDITIQEASDFFFEHNRYSWKLYDEKKHHYRSKNETYEYFFKQLDESGKTYCNSNVFLVCKSESWYYNPSAKKKCLCPSDMTWEKGKCVFKNGKYCYLSRDRNGEGNFFIKFDIIGETFHRDFHLGECEEKTKCELNNCASDQNFESYVPPKDLAVWMKKYVEAGTDYS